MEDVSELPRLYIDSTQLRAKLDGEILKKKIDEKKELLIRQHKPVDQTAITKEIITNSLCQFLLNNLQLCKEEHVRIFVAPSTNDPEFPNMMLNKPSSLMPYHVNKPAKISSSADINHVLSSLKAESAELRNATRLAQLATSSVDGFKLMLAEKMKMENQLKAKYSVPRLRWIQVIKRVLVLNYVQKIRKRLGMPALEENEDSKQEDDLFHAAHGLIPSSQSNDVLDLASASQEDVSLRSISVDATSHARDLPSIKSSSTSRRRNRQHHAHHKISFLQQELPVIDTMYGQSKKLFQPSPMTPTSSMSSAKSTGSFTRRSLDNAHFTGTNTNMMSASTTSLTTGYDKLLLPSISMHDGEEDGGHVPSLLESYHHISQRIPAPSSVPMITNSRSIRTVRLTIS